MCFFKKRKARQHAIEQEKAQLAKEEANKAVIVEEKKEELKPEVKVEKVTEKPVAPTPEVKVEKPVAPTPEVKVEKPVAPTPVEKPKKVEPAPASQEIKPSETVKTEKAPKIQKYHVSQNKDENTENFKKWRVRKEGSEKTIKFFDTQKEAIDFAAGLAESAGSSVVIHKVDGSIRKQDYVKKE